MPTNPANFAMAQDNSRTPMQVGSALKFQDNSLTPVVSGSGTSMATTTLVPPTGAVVLKVVASAAIKIGDNSTLDGTAGHGFRTVGANVEFSYPCSDVANIYIKAAGGNYTLEFHFEVARAQD